MACAICEIRRPRRFCPGVQGDICTICCGTEREETVNCPLDCEYLQEAHTHEKPPLPDPAQIPNSDIQVTEPFIIENRELFDFLAIALVETALDTPGAVDFDVRDALDALIRTYRSLQSGIYYENLPQNAIAEAIFHSIQDSVENLREKEQQRGISTVRDAAVLGILVFLHRIERDKNNGRKRGRAFLDFLHKGFQDSVDTAPNTSLIVP